jgi:glucosamine--fructose-6-phosphate aminotransferase (isomerizing)
MCGIVGYIGKGGGVKAVISGLNNLEYRGYDSAGIAVCDQKNNFFNIKQAGRVENLEKEINSLGLPPISLAIGHTRWATHGAPTKTNAHPHSNSDGTIFVVHNGIIENYQAIKELLTKDGYTFVSNTDTEVIPHLIDYFYKKIGNIEKAFEQAIQKLEGAYAIAMITKINPHNIYIAKLSSPLAIGISRSAMMVGSDASAVADTAKKIVYLEDYELAVVTKDKYKIKNFKKNKIVNHQPEQIELESIKTSLGNFKHYMLKEIFDAPKTVQSAILGRANLESNSVKLGGLERVENRLEEIDRILIVACGTSYYAGLVGEYLLEEIAQIPVEVQLASEFKYRHEPLSNKTAMLAISQSGETADTIAALKKVESSGILRLGVVNAPGSTISRITDAGVYCHAGPEISVASTKAFIAQVTVLTLIALKLGKGKSPLFHKLLKEITNLPNKLEKLLLQAEEIKAIANKYKKYRDFLFIGRGYEYPVALEGALKLKEVSYIHAEGYAAGEMKHGPLAMIDKDFPTFALADGKELSDKIISNMQEIKARGGKIIAVSTRKNARKLQGLADDIIIIQNTLGQCSPILEATVVQLFAYYVALAKKLDVDKPRNLAKSVTVE